MSKLTVTIPDDLHQKIREELERQGITTSQFIEQAVTTFFEKPKGVSNMATRTLAFQVQARDLEHWHFRYPRNFSSASKPFLQGTSKSITAN